MLRPLARRILIDLADLADAVSATLEDVTQLLER